MPPRVRDVNAVGTGIGAWYESIPPITRVYATGLFVVTVLMRFQFIRPYWIALLWPQVIKQFEVWRLVTNFFVMGKLNLTWIIKMIWLLTYGKTLESQTFQHVPEDFAFMLLFGAICTLVASGLLLLTFHALMVFNALALVYMLLYVWSRHYPEQQVSIYGLFQVQAFYVPFIFLALEVMMDPDIPWNSIVGLLVGHLHYYLTEVYPTISGQRLLVTPRFLKNLLADWGVGRRVNTHAAVGQDRFRAFGGRGARLGTQ